MAGPCPMKIITVVGARPQFIKAAAVSREIARRPAIREIIVHTGQHFDRNMSEIFFEEMEIPRPAYHLEVNSLGHGAMTGRMIEKIEEVLLQERPDILMVYGDTNSTLAGALAARKLHVRVVHVEAGLRSFNMRMPEEINRILTDRISDILCCPTETAVENLRREGFGNFPCSIVRTGDVMQDAALYYGARSADKSTIIRDLRLADREYALCTIHRAENTDDPARLKGLFSALLEIGNDLPVVMPLHPRTQKLAAALGPRLSGDDRLIILPPVGYFDMIELLKRTAIVLTDSGGLQKEAYFFRKICLTLREETEWTELVDCHVNVVVGAEKDRIVHAFREAVHAPLPPCASLYGDGNASALIVDALSG